MGSKWAHSTCLCSPNSPKVSLEKHIFDAFLTNFGTQNSPFSRHFVTLESAKWLAMGSKRAHFTCLGSPKWSRIIFGKKHLFDPFFVPKQPIFKAFWDSRRAKTAHHELKMCQKHQSSILVLVWGCQRPMCTNSGAFGGLEGAVRGHVVDLEGPRGAFGTGKSSCMCRVATISLDLVIFGRF